MSRAMLQSPTPVTATRATTARHSTLGSLLLAAGILGTVTFVAYRPTLSSEFVRLDDYQYVIDNELVRRPSLAGVYRFFSEVTWPSTVVGYYQPLTMTSLMLDVLLSGGGDDLDPRIFHLTNILLHAVNSVLVMLLLRSVAGGVAIPLLGAALFALHPVQVESVAWISQRKTLLASMFAIASVCCYLRYGQTHKRRWLAAATVLYAVSGLAKPTVVPLPLVLPLLDWWPLRRPVVRSLAEKVPMAVLMAAMGWVAFTSQATAAQLAVPNITHWAMLGQWVALLSYNAILYVGNVVWPMSLSPYRAIPGDLALANPVILASVSGMAALTAAWITSWKWSRPLFVGLGAFGLVLLPALGGLRFNASCVADRFVYLPLVFLLMPLAVMARRIEGRRPDRVTIVRACLALPLVPLCVLMRPQQGIWKNSKALWTHVVEAVPTLGKAHSNLALISMEEGNFELALSHALRSLEDEPDHAQYMHLLGRIYVRLGRGEEGAAAIRRAIGRGLGPDEHWGYQSLAEALVVQGDIEAAQAAFDQAAALGMDRARSCKRLGEVALRFARRHDLAADYYRQAVRADPEDPTVRWNLGTALEYQGLDAEALNEYEAAIAICAQQGLAVPDYMTAAAKKVRRRLKRTATAPPKG